VVRLQAAPGVDAIRVLRRLLKLARRRWGLRAISIEAAPEFRKQPAPEECVGKWSDRDGA
jgi:hypothetical protein